MKIILNANQKIDLEKQHKIERDGRVRDRIKAVLLCSEWWSQRQIAQALRINESTVAEHLNDYLYADGKLKPENGGSVSKLSFKQTSELMSHIEDSTYTSTLEIIAYVKQTYVVSYTQQGMYDWLMRHNFSYKKPKESPAKADPIRQEQFVKDYEKLKATTPDNEPKCSSDSSNKSNLWLD